MKKAVLSASGDTNLAQFKVRDIMTNPRLLLVGDDRDFCHLVTQ
jgi:hypothetical protein